LYEFINHYISEGIDCLFLIDDNSEDNYRDIHKQWLQPLIDSGKVVFIQMTARGSSKQANEYNFHLEKVQQFDWVHVCDLDEFSFAVPKDHNNNTIKKILNNNMSKYDYITIDWKIFSHKSNYFQPKSVIHDNIFTYSQKTHKYCLGKGRKYFARTKNISGMGIHTCNFITTNNHIHLPYYNDSIQINHYRTQSEEYLRGVKEIRGGLIHHYKYRNYKENDLCNQKCILLSMKRKKLIAQIRSMIQVKPQLYVESSFYLENKHKYLNQNTSKEDDKYLTSDPDTRSKFIENNIQLEIFKDNLPL